MHPTDPATALRDVLYVEDNPVNALLMEALFERRPDLRLSHAPDCASALPCARARPPALLLLDLRLPDGHGCALLPQLRALPGLQRVPAVAVTAEAPEDLDLRGFDGYWPKPLATAEVLAALDRLLPPRQRPPSPAGRLPAGTPVAAGKPAAGSDGPLLAVAR